MRIWIWRNKVFSRVHSIRSRLQLWKEPPTMTFWRNSTRFSTVTSQKNCRLGSKIQVRAWKTKCSLMEWTWLTSHLLSTCSKTKSMKQPLKWWWRRSRKWATRSSNEPKNSEGSWTKNLGRVKSPFQACSTTFQPRIRTYWDRAMTLLRWVFLTPEFIINSAKAANLKRLKLTSLFPLKSKARTLSWKSTISKT